MLLSVCTCVFVIPQMVMSKPVLPEDQFRVQKWFDEKAGSVSHSGKDLRASAEL